MDTAVQLCLKFSISCHGNCLQHLTETIKGWYSKSQGESSAYGETSDTTHSTRWTSLLSTASLTPGHTCLLSHSHLVTLVYCLTHTWSLLSTVSLTPRHSCLLSHSHLVTLVYCLTHQAYTRFTISLKIYLMLKYNNYCVLLMKWP